jgi:hypothetical protein
VAGALVILFLMSVARFYHPGTRFTALIGFKYGHESEAPAMRDVPHFDSPPWASYDGQFYAQRALDPLCRDPLVDCACCCRSPSDSISCSRQKRGPHASGHGSWRATCTCYPRSG